MAKYKRDGRIIIDRYKKEPEEKTDWADVCGFVVLLFIAAAALSSCVG